MLEQKIMQTQTNAWWVLEVQNIVVILGDGTLGAREFSCKRANNIPKLPSIDYVAKKLGTSHDVNPFAPEPPVTARADPGPFYPLWRHQF